jgi:hypothetical protein
MAVGKIGGILFIAYICASFLMKPLRKFQFRLNAAKELFVAKSKQEYLFKNIKTKIEPN